MSDAPLDKLIASGRPWHYLHDWEGEHCRLCGERWPQAAGEICRVRARLPEPPWEAEHDEIVGLLDDVVAVIRQAQAAIEAQCYDEAKRQVTTATNYGLNAIKSLALLRERPSP